MATITAVVTGIIVSSPFTVDGIDHAGIFGSAGASLIGDAFTVNYTGTITCDAISFGSQGYCAGYSTPDPGQGLNPVQDAVLTINGHSYDFGNGVYGVFGPEGQDVTVSPGTAISTGNTYNLGEFFIALSNSAPPYSASGRFGFETVVFNGVPVPPNVPAPIVGSGLPAFALVLAAIVLILRIAPNSCAVRHNVHP